MTHTTNPQRDADGALPVVDRAYAHPYPGDTWVMDDYELDVTRVVLWVDGENQLRWDVTLTNPRRIEQMEASE